jgi:hypothetical protein
VVESHAKFNQKDIVPRALWIAEKAQPFIIVDHFAFKDLFALYRQMDQHGCHSAIIEPLLHVHYLMHLE